MATTVLDDDWDEYADGAYRAVNNVWNKGSLTNGSGYTQSVTLDKATFPGGITFAWDWNAPFNSSIYAYPEVIFGYKPWDEGVGTSSTARRSTNSGIWRRASTWRSPGTSRTTTSPSKSG